MFRLAKYPTPGLVLLILLPAFLILSYFALARSNNAPAHTLETSSKHVEVNSMIFRGEPRVASEGTHDWVVYHTGASPHDTSTVKKVRLSVLDQHPDKRWRPVTINPNFLGFYRLKILDQQVAPEE